MSKYRQLTYGHPVPQSFFDAFQEFISTLVANFTLTIPQGSNNQVQVFVDPTQLPDSQVGIGIDGLWRYISATINTQVTGAAGTYDLFVTCGENNFVTNPSPPPPETDNTNYAFALTAVATGTAPTGVPHSRRVGQCVTDGTRILSLRQMVGTVDGQQVAQPGFIQMSAAANPPVGWLVCNGQAVSRTTYSALYAALGGPTSPWGQGDGSTTFNVPDLRGRVPVGVGTAQGVSGPATNRVLGVADGLEQFALATAQLPAHGHHMDFMSQGEDRDHEHLFPGITSQNDSPDHAHGGTTDGDSPDHSHSQWGADTHWTYGGGTFNTPTVVGSWGVYDHGTAGASARHSHTFSTGGANTRHTHYVPAVWTSQRNTAHLHEVVGDTQNTGSGNNVSVVQPLQVVNYLIKT